jgi:hypothetical protein
MEIRRYIMQSQSRLTLDCMLVLACLCSLSCEQKLVIANYSCPPPSTSIPEDASGIPSEVTIEAPWSTSFEDGFCDFTVANGSCYADGLTSCEVVTEPVHSGRYAAAFTINADGTLTNSQTRCVREGQLPTAAYYGAWYYVPVKPQSVTNWNLFHFRGGDSTSDTTHGLWDVSMVLDSNDTLQLSVFNFLKQTTIAASNSHAVPISKWFHVEVFFKRAKDATGEFSVYLDGSSVIRLTKLTTDDTQLGQWYLGNLVAAISPAKSTLYVDDVSIRPEN